MDIDIQEDYSMKRAEKQREPLMERLGGRGWVISMIILFVAMMAVGIGWIEIDARRAWEAQWIDSYPMANQHIEFHYAEVGE